MSSRRAPTLAVLVAALAALAAACGGAGGPRTVSADWPVAVELPAGSEPRYERVVLFTIDTLRSDHVSAYGYPRQTTPFFDSLAARGLLFTSAMATISHTAPSHSSMLTGVPPLVHGVLHNGYKMDADAVDLARVFAAAGFETAAFVNTKFLEGVATSFGTVRSSTRSGNEVVDNARAWLTGARKSPRFFLWVHLFEPHRWKDLAFEVRDRPLWNGPTPENFYDTIAALHGLTEMGTEGLLAQKWETTVGKPLELDSVEQYLRFVDSYDNLIHYADAQLANLYGAIQELKLPGSTLWVVTSDHGEGLASHGIAGHGGHLYQEQLHVPLLLHASDGSLPARRIGELVSHLDLYPTLVATLGGSLRAPPGLIEGRSLWDLAGGRPADWPERSVFAQRKPTGETLYALQDGRFKLLRSGSGDEFYDLRADPCELENLAGRSPAEREALSRALTERLQVFESYRQGTGEQEIPADVQGELRDLGYVR